MKYLLALALFCTPFTAFAAIAFDATSQMTIPDTTTSNTLAVTIPATNPVLWVGVENNNQNGFSTFTYNSVAMTNAVTYNESNGQQISLWYVVAPASGSHTLSVVRNDSTGNSWYQATTYTGVDQTSPLDNNTSCNGTTATTLTCTLTTVADNTISVLVGYANGGSNDVAAGTNSTRKAIMATNRSAYFDSTGVGPKTPAGSFGMTFTTDTAGTVIAGVMASMKPFVAAAAASSNPILGLVRAFFLSH